MKGRKWDNCNSIINKYIKKKKDMKAEVDLDAESEISGRHSHTCIWWLMWAWLGLWLELFVRAFARVSPCSLDFLTL